MLQPLTRSASSRTFRILFLALLFFAGAARPIAQEQPIQILFDFPEVPHNPVGRLAVGPDGSLYGTLVSQATTPAGIFVMRRDASGSFTYELLHEFTPAADGTLPYAGLTFGGDGHLYGVTTFGGVSGRGTIFRITTDGVFTRLHSFAGPDGREPYGSLVAATDGSLYGTTAVGGTYGLGTIFRISTAGVFTHMHSFTGADGIAPVSELLQASDGNFYGVAAFGGSAHAGTVYRMTPAGAVTRVHSFAGQHDGERPVGRLIQASDGALYGTTHRGGGVYGDGLVYKVTTSGVYTVLYRFLDWGGKPIAGLTEGPSGWFYGFTTGRPLDPNSGSNGFRISAAGVFQFAPIPTPAPMVAASELVPFGDTYYGVTSWGGAGGGGTIFSFTPGSPGETIYHFPETIPDPHAISLGRDGSFYGVTRNAGSDWWRKGSFFKLTPDGRYTPLHVLSNREGTDPSPLMQAADGNFYGTTRLGGGHGSGIVFRLTPTGALDIIHSFTDYDGIAGTRLLQASDGNFYGTAEYGGASGVDLLPGMVYRLTPSGVFTKLYAFTGGTDGGTPRTGLIQGRDGHLYGTTCNRGPGGYGTIFRITLGGVLTTLHGFSGADGGCPSGELLQASDGDFYGVTSEAGAANLGTVFRMTPAGALTTLQHFTGARPLAPLIEAPDGSLYGTAGTVFRLDPLRAYSVVHTFPADGREGFPNYSGVLLGPDGALHGTTRGGYVAGAQHGLFYRIPLE